MSDIPGARVVRGGGRGGGPDAGAQVRPQGPVLRLAPRAVPRALVWRLLFGGSITVFGWLFATLGMVFVLGFLPMLDLSVAGYDRRADATITGVEETSSSENERKIHRVRYTFVDEAGVERRGESYTKDPPAAPGTPGTWEVEYRSGDPSRSQLRGMRQRPFSPLLLFVLIFPIIGIAVVGWQLRTARRNLRLLRYGLETRGKLVRKEETSVTYNDRPVMALTFEYEVDGRRHRATVETLDTALLEDDDREAMVYDPHSPGRATTLDHLPGSPRIDAAGELEARPGLAFHLLILPVAFVCLVIATAMRMI